MGMLLIGERARPAILDRVAHAMERADARIAAPGKHRLVGAAHADELVVDQVGRHADQREAPAALADHLVAGGVRNEMGEAFHRERVAVADIGLHGGRQGHELSHQTLPDRTFRAFIYGASWGGSNRRGDANRRPAREPVRFALTAAVIVWCSPPLKVTIPCPLPRLNRCPRCRRRSRPSGRARWRCCAWRGPRSATRSTTPWCSASKRSSRTSRTT